MTTTTIERQTPWAKMGKDVSSTRTAADALRLAGLDWHVELQPTFRTPFRDDVDSDGRPIRVPDMDRVVKMPKQWAVVRTDTNATLSVRSDQYKTFGNAEALEFLDNLVESGDLAYDTAFEARGGRSVGLSVLLGEELTIADDVMQMYMIMRTSHDGSSRLKVDVAPVRFSCFNQSGLITSTAKSSWGVTHTADIPSKLEEARIHHGLGLRYAEEYAKLGNRLVGVRVTDDNLIAMLKRTIPERSRKDDEIAAIISNYRNSPNIQNYRDTAWGAINAATEYWEHVRSNRSASALFGKVVDGGPDAKARNKLARQMLELAA